MKASSTGIPPSSARTSCRAKKSSLVSANTRTFAGSAKAIVFELVRHVAKQESPLVQLGTSSNVISTIATLTFYGVDRVGNNIQTTGQMQIEFGNFADK